MDKLNGIPTFSIVNKDGNAIAMAAADGEKRACCWFTDPQEAKAILRAVASANPEAGLTLTCHGMGGAFEVCNGWGDGDKATASSPEGAEIELRLQGNHALVNQTSPKLQKLLADAGLDPGCWQLPVFLCEKLASVTLMPLFLSPRDLALVWEKSGRDRADLPKDVTVIDIRMLVQQMQTDSSPWKIFHFIGSEEAAKLAADIEKGVDLTVADADDAAPAAAAAGGAAEEAVAAVDEEEEVMV